MFARTICALLVVTLMIGFAPAKAVSAEPELIDIGFLFEVDGIHVWVIYFSEFDVSIWEWVYSYENQYSYFPLPNVEFAIY